MKIHTTPPTAMPAALFRLVGGLTLVAACLPALAQVRYFDRPPTPEEIRAALRGSPVQQPAGAAGTRSLTGGAKTRSIEWNGGAAAPQTASTQQIEQSSGSGAAAFAGGSGGAGSSGGAQAFQGGGGNAIALPVNFDSGSARLSPGSANYIQAMAQALAADPSLRLVIEGHTDGAGNPQTNMMLSWDRAFTVFRTLVERYGIDPSRLQPLGKGATEPMAGTSPMDGVNRRVQFRPIG